MNTKQSWYSPKSSNHQGTIVSEPDGRTVAVAYDKADAPLLAAAPALLKALMDAREVLAVSLAWENSANIRRQIDNAIFEATQEAP